MARPTDSRSGSETNTENKGRKWITNGEIAMLTREGAWTRLEMRLPESAYQPCGFAAGDTNLYRYVGNAPTNATDPSGLKDYKLGDVPDPKISADVGSGPWNVKGGFFGRQKYVAIKQ